MPSAELWWPRGHGGQHMYSVEVRYFDDDSNSKFSDTKGESYQSILRNVGVRSVELMQDAYEPVKASTSTSDPSPASFYFRINGEPIFFRGANLIPFDSIPDRVSQTDRTYILEAAAEANFNSVRIWGGGMYQPDDLYDTADKLGLLVWQEIMLSVSFVY